ncbi:MAG: D-alanyl-D-alanine carboxypeptidase/D-alanyl-D-alanine-endopeptidase [Bdellovibrionales bacterium]|nr:D-alanyl-D-alanine carboxypeptidase/D-alanyl-D-alanine-endopeptidase [Bdellovibrionales bacterium]
MSFLLALIVGLGSARADELPARLAKIVKGSSLPASSLGIAVFDLAQISPALTYGLNEQQDMIPASTTKIATAVAVLDQLGPHFKFQTTLWSSGAVKNGVLQGDLILKGGGDAGFVSETMWFLVNDFLRSGIKKIEGSIVVDDTDFDTIRNDPSRDPERVDRAYDAPVGAMSFNWNSLNIYIRPTQVGEAPSVYLDPIASGFKVDNKAKTVNKSANNLVVSRVGDRIVVRGTIGLSHPEIAVYKNIDDPAQWAGENLAAFLAQRGIEIKGKVKMGKKPEVAKLLAKAESKPVSLHVSDMMKFSNNYVAEMLTKNIAAQKGTTPASLDEGMKLVRGELESMGIDGKRFVLLNPSGLSRRNRIKAMDLAQILVQASKKFPWFAEFLSSMPLAGQDGTLKRRMKDNEGWVRAKTGNLNGVIGLAGYAGRKDGSIRAFAFIFNGKGEQGETARHLFDALATELVQ